MHLFVSPLTRSLDHHRKEVRVSGLLSGSFSHDIYIYKFVFFCTFFLYTFFLLQYVITC